VHQFWGCSRENRTLQSQAAAPYKRISFLSPEILKKYPSCKKIVEIKLYDRTTYNTNPNTFTNNSESLNYSRAEIAATARQQLMSCT
jgi:hypothetical protein